MVSPTACKAAGVACGGSSPSTSTKDFEMRKKRKQEGERLSMAFAASCAPRGRASRASRKTVQEGP